MKPTVKKNNATALKIGAGVLTAATLAAAGAYLLSDKKRMAKAKVWVEKARKEVGRQVKSAKSLSEKQYVNIVDEATKRYAMLHNIDKAEVLRIANDIKNEWNRMQSQAKKMAKPAVKAKGARKKARA